MPKPGTIWTMKCLRNTRNTIAVLCCLSIFCSLVAPGQGFSATEEFFKVLQIGTHTYRNVTVTTKAKEYVFILHSGGMGNIKVADLPADLREQLGYGKSAKQKSVAAKAEVWARQSVPGQAIERSFRQAMNGKNITEHLRARVGPQWMIAAIGAGLIFYIFYCYCAMLICQKTGNPPGVLVWLPFVQLIPMLRAARMSPLWFVALMVPVVNLIAHFVWSVKIVKARSKPTWVALVLLLPLTNILAFLYLAFSDAPKAKPVRRVTEIMTLEAA